MTSACSIALESI